MHISITSHNVVRGDGQGRVLYEIISRGVEKGHRFACFADRMDFQLVSEHCEWIPVQPWLTKPNLLKVFIFGLSSKRHAATRKSPTDISIGVGFSRFQTVDVCLAQFVHRAWLDLPVHTSRVTKPPYSWYQYIYSRINAKLERSAFLNARAVIAVSKGVKEQLIQRVGVPANRISVIHNAVDPNEFSPGAGDRDCIGALSTFKGSLALFVGDIRTPRKNLDTVLRALVEVTNLGLVVAGDKSNSPYPKLAEELRVQDRVAFVGFRNDIAELCRATDFFVFPSRYEPFGLVVLEAMASGRPVITSAVTGASDLVDPSSGIVLSDPENIVELSDAMRMLSNDPVLRAEMGKSARRIAEVNTWEKMADRYLELFCGLVP